MTDAKAYENRRITEFNKWIEGEIDLNRELSMPPIYSTPSSVTMRCLSSMVMYAILGLLTTYPRAVV